MSSMNDLVEQRHLGYPRHEYEEETFLSDDMVQESSRVDEEEATRAAPLARKTSTSTPLALDLSYRNISRVDKTICGYNLSTLILNNNKIGEVMGLKNLVNLKRLDLSFNLIRRIEGLESLTNLEVLSFYHNQIAEIDGMEHCKNIRSLSLGHNLITLISQKGLKQLESMSQLKDLNLSHNPVCNTELYKETILDAIPHLRYLDNCMIPLDWSRRPSNRNLVDRRKIMASYDHHQCCSIQNIIIEIDQISMEDKDAADHDSTISSPLDMRKSILDILQNFKSCIDDTQIQVSRSIQDLESLLKSKVLSHLQDVESNIRNDNNEDNVNDGIMLMELEFMQSIHLTLDSWNKDTMATSMNTIQSQASAAIEQCNNVISTDRINNSSMMESIAQAIQSRIQSLHQNSVSMVENIREEIYRTHRVRVQQIARRIKAGGGVEEDEQCGSANEQTS